MMLLIRNLSRKLQKRQGILALPIFLYSSIKLLAKMEEKDGSIVSST
jgi:hypothetical protein